MKKKDKLIICPPKMSKIEVEEFIKKWTKVRSEENSYRKRIKNQKETT